MIRETTYTCHLIEHLHLLLRLVLECLQLPIKFGFLLLLLVHELEDLAVDVLKLLATMLLGLLQVGQDLFCLTLETFDVVVHVVVLLVDSQGRDKKKGVIVVEKRKKTEGARDICEYAQTMLWLTAAIL